LRLFTPLSANSEQWSTPEPIRTREVGWSIIVVFVGAATGLGLLLLTIQRAPAQTWTTNGWQGTLLWTAVMFLGAALYEEIAFRGFLYPQLYLKFRGSHRVRFWTALLVSQLLFAIGHVPAHLMIRHLSGRGLWTTVILQGLIGVVLLLLYLRTRNLWISVGIHGLVNAPTPLLEGTIGPAVFLVVLLTGWPWIVRRSQERGLARVEARGTIPA
jgi:membrane protease YdiL (CAAX protease family)